MYTPSTDSIGTLLTQACKDDITLHLAEAATDTYPYAVYNYAPVAHYTKDKLYKWSADVEIQLVAKEFYTMQYIASHVVSDITYLDGQEKLTIKLTDKDYDCNEGIYTYTLNFHVNQYL